MTAIGWSGNYGEIIMQYIRRTKPKWHKWNIGSEKSEIKMKKVADISSGSKIITSPPPNEDGSEEKKTKE